MISRQIIFLLTKEIKIQTVITINHNGKELGNYIKNDKIVIPPC